MAAITMGGLTALADIGLKILERVIPDPQAKAAAQLEFLKAQGELEFQELQARLGVITAEASSADPWTSRSRPMFLYLFYAIIVALVIVAPFVGVFFPAQMQTFFANVKAGFDAIPEAMWGVFAAGYLGYAGARTIEKVKGKG